MEPMVLVWMFPVTNLLIIMLLIALAHLKSTHVFEKKTLASSSIRGRGNRLNLKISEMKNQDHTLREQMALTHFAESIMPIPQEIINGIDAIVWLQ